MLAASGAPLAERYTHHHSMLMLEAALEKARRAHRPLIITSLGNPTDDPSQIHMDPSLLSALDMQVCSNCTSAANSTCKLCPCQLFQLWQAIVHVITGTHIYIHQCTYMCVPVYIGMYLYICVPVYIYRIRYIFLF